MIPKTRVVLAGGRGLGSLYSGLAIAEHLADLCPHIEASMMGSGDPSEQHLAKSVGLDYQTIPAQASPRNPLECVRFVTDNAAGYLAANWQLGERKASLVVGLGGPVSAVVSRAACSRGIPLVLLENNANASKTARSLGPYAEAVCLTYEQTQAQLPVSTPTMLTGTPVRSEFWSDAPQKNTPSAHEKLLVVLAGAGTRQARLINAVLPSVLSNMSECLENWRIVHQCGEGCLRETEDHYQAVGVPAVVVSHVDQMGALVSEADLVVSRAGASTFAELAAYRVPTVLAPWPESLGNHQISNAAILAQAGACEMVDQRASEPFSAGMDRALRELLTDDLARKRLSQAIGDWAKPYAGQQIAELCAGVLGLAPVRAAA